MDANRTLGKLCPGAPLFEFNGALPTIIVVSPTPIQSGRLVYEVRYHTPDIHSIVPYDFIALCCGISILQGM